MRKRGCSALGLIVLFFIINLFIVSGLGVSPGRTVVSFVPNEVYKGEVCFRPEGNPHLKIDVEGELAEYITLEKEELFIQGDSGCVEYTLRMPASFDKPGRHTANIRGLEIIGEQEGGGLITAKVRINSQLWVLVPYPGKYLEINYFRASNVEAGEKVTFEAKATSRGDHVISLAKGYIYVYNREDRLIGGTQTDSAINIETDEERTFTATWDSGDYEKGNYHALLRLKYDGSESNATTKFKLGGLDVELINYTRELAPGGIKEFYLTVDSIWSEAIPNLKAEVDVYNPLNHSEDDEPLASFETLTRVLPAWGTQRLLGYLDTSKLDLGVYDLDIQLFFANLTKGYEGNLSIIEEEEEAVPSEEKGFLGMIGSMFTLKTIIIILIILLIVIIGILISTLVPRKKKK